MSMWSKYWLNDKMLKSACEKPDILRLPVGSCVYVRKDRGYAYKTGEYRPQVGYVTPENLERLRVICEAFKGFELLVGEELKDDEWRRGWVDTYYPLSEKPVNKCILPGMYSVEFRVTNVEEARVTLKAYKDIPVCPTITFDDYLDTDKREIIDIASRYFTHYWLYGRPYAVD